MDNVEVPPEFFDDLVGPIDMFAFDEPAVGLLVTFLKNPLGRNASR